MLVSVITPSHDTKYLMDAYEYLKNQTYKNWERVILLNGPAALEHPIEDERVKIFRDEYTRGIGALKHKAFSLGNGEILLELDHDDILTLDCLEKVVEAFQAHEEVGFVYSDNAKLGDFIPYQERHGWKPKDFVREGKKLTAMESLPITPLNMGYIWFMPDHVRAWRADVYHDIGGHDTSLEVLDDQDLVQRTFLQTKFYHIPEVLYIYRITGDNTSIERNQEIQQKTVEMYDSRIYELAWRRADINGLEKIDLCGGINKQDKWTSVDMVGGDICADLNKKWPLKDGSVGVIRAHDALEHLVDKQHTMSEIHRVLAPGGILLSRTPSTDGRGARQDPTHVSFWNENAFWYRIKDREQKRFIHNDKILFREGRLYTSNHPNNIAYVHAHLEKR